MLAFLFPTIGERIVSIIINSILHLKKCVGCHTSDYLQQEACSCLVVTSIQKHCYVCLAPERLFSSKEVASKRSCCWFLLRWWAASGLHPHPTPFLVRLAPVGSSQREKCIGDDLCKCLPAALVSADSTSVNTIPHPNHCCQHLPCQS